MATPDARTISQAIDNAGGRIAHAIRRSTALREAISICPEDATIEEMLELADRLATWLRGSVEEEVRKPRPPSSYGEPEA